jgi:hypothetical protein
MTDDQPPRGHEHSGLRGHVQHERLSAAVRKLVVRAEVEMPISSTVAALLTGDVSAADVVPLLMGTAPRSSSTGSRSDPSATGQHSERT